MHDITITVCIDISADTNKLYKRDIREDLAYSTTDDITSYLNDNWGLSNTDFFVLLEVNNLQSCQG